MTQRRIYQDEYPYHITITTAHREPIFEEEENASLFLRAALGSCRLKGFALIAMGILPDHVHLMVVKAKAIFQSQRRLESLRWGENGKSVKGPPPLFPNRSQRTLSRVRWVNQKATISDLMQSIKGTLSRKLGYGPVWQRRFNSRIVDTEERFHNTLTYILHNYQKHGLPEKYGREPYCFYDPGVIAGLF